MPDPDLRVELRHLCAICGQSAELPSHGGMQLSAIDATRRGVVWAVHPACLQTALAPTLRSAFEQHFAL
jgi:hypothetical protein